MRICVIFNPTARGQKAQRLAHLLPKLTSNCHCKPTSYPGEARLLAANAVKDGYDTIVAAGGDGTVNEVLNGIGDDPDGFSKARLGVLPMGTINVFARELKIPLTLERAWKTILAGKEITVDLPEVEFVSYGKPARRYFAQLAGAGFDSKAVEMVNTNLKSKMGSLAYLEAGLKALKSNHSMIVVKTPATVTNGEMILIGNGRFYGGNFAIFPKADLCDGKLEVCIFPKINWQILWRASIGLFTKQLHRLCGVKELQAEALTLSSNQKTSLQLDGEYVGELPAKFSVRPKTLRVIVP